MLVGLRQLLPSVGQVGPTSHQIRPTLIDLGRLWQVWAQVRPNAAEEKCCWSSVVSLWHNFANTGQPWPTSARLSQIHAEPGLPGQLLRNVGALVQQLWGNFGARRRWNFGVPVSSNTSTGTMLQSGALSVPPMPPTRAGVPGRHGEGRATGADGLHHHPPLNAGNPGARSRAPPSLGLCARASARIGGTWRGVAAQTSAEPSGCDPEGGL